MLMASPSFRIDRTQSIILDTSAAINLNATGQAGRIIEALPSPITVTDILMNELKQGREKGRRDFDAIENLLSVGLIDVIELNAEAERHFERLVVGPAAETLDDGEAATIAQSIASGSIPVIDERKATALCARRFQDLQLASSLDLLLQPEVTEAIGTAQLRKAVIGALQIGKMSVPVRFEQWIVDLIGVEEAARCPSLPRRLRQGKLSASSFV